MQCGQVFGLDYILVDSAPPPSIGTGGNANLHGVWGAAASGRRKGGPTHPAEAGFLAVACATPCTVLWVAAHLRQARGNFDDIAPLCQLLREAGEDLGQLLDRFGGILARQGIGVVQLLLPPRHTGHHKALEAFKADTLSIHADPPPARDVNAIVRLERGRNRHATYRTDRPRPAGRKRTLTEAANWWCVWLHRHGVSLAWLLQLPRWQFPSVIIAHRVGVRICHLTRHE